MKTSIDAILTIFWNNSILYRYFLQYLDSESLVQFAYINSEMFHKRQFILNLVFAQSYGLIRFTQEKCGTLNCQIEKIRDLMIYYNSIRGENVNIHILFENLKLQKQVEKCFMDKRRYILALTA